MRGLKALVGSMAFDLLPPPVLQALRKRYYRRLLRRATPRQEPDMTVLTHLVRPGDSVLDVGANVGLYTKRLSELVGDTGRVVSIEPVPQTFELLQYNVEKLRLGNVQLLQCAISHGHDVVEIEIPQYGWGGENLYEARVVMGRAATTGQAPHLRVSATDLDSLFKSIASRITFIKCDVEGHELECVRGAGELITASLPAWLMEISGDPDAPSSRAAETFQLMERAGYGVYWFDGIRLIARGPAEKSVNYFFLAPSHVGRLKDAGLLAS
jgi:FkbM family methyltransferase